MTGRDPSNSAIQGFRASASATLGNVERAQVIGTRAQTADPLNVTPYWVITNAHWINCKQLSPSEHSRIPTIGTRHKGHLGTVSPPDESPLRSGCISILFRIGGQTMYACPATRRTFRAPKTKSQRHRLSVAASALLFVWSAILLLPGAAHAAITSAPIIVDGFSIPAGTDVTLDSDGAPLDATLKSPVTEAGTNLPAGAVLIIGEGNKIWAIWLPDGQTGSFRDMQVNGDLWLAIRPANDDDLCPDIGGSWRWATSAWNLLPHWSLKASSLSTTKPNGILTLSQDYVGSSANNTSTSTSVATDVLAIPKDSLILRSGEDVKAIYFRGAGKLAGHQVPSGTLVLFEGEDAAVWSHADISAGRYVAKAGELFALYTDGSLAFFSTRGSASLPDGLAVPDGSFIGLEGGHAYYAWLPANTPVRGFKAVANRTICFDGQDDVHMRLAEDGQLRGERIPKGSDVIVRPDGSIMRALFYEPLTLQGVKLALFYQNDPKIRSATFFKNGQLRSANNENTVTVGSLQVSPGLVIFYDDGSLHQGVPVSDTNIQGVPVMGGRVVMLDPDGSPYVFTAASDWSKEATHLHRGEEYLGSYTKNDTFVLLNNADLTEMINAAVASLIDPLPDKIRENSGKFPFGNMGNMSIHDVRTGLSTDHIDVHGELSVQNMFTNPPFADCDGNIWADFVVRWYTGGMYAMGQNQDLQYKPVFGIYVSQYGGGVSHHFCPGTDFIRAVATIGSAFGFVASPDQLLQNFVNRFAGKLRFQKALDDKNQKMIAQYLQAVTQDGEVVADSIRYNRLYIDGGQLKMDYSYEVRHPEGPGGS